MKHVLDVSRQSGFGMNLWMYQGNLEGINCCKSLTGGSIKAIWMRHELVKVSWQCG